ncbi:MAG TPA: ABC-2 family transporter protein [Micromonosporaceae bacterium]|nr:ABC-2 family transporter protein [Micromonosporaceae bacterium]
MANAGAYARLVRAQVRAQAQYRVSLWVDVGTSILFGLLDLAVVLVMFRVTPSLGGFGPAEVFLMAGLSGTGFAMADLCVGSIERIGTYVRTGALDAVLVRPLGTLGQLLATDFAPRRAGRMVIMAIILVAATRFAGVDWTPARVALAVLTPLAAAVLFSAVFIGTAVVAFWWIESREFASGLTYGGREFATYPMSVYDGLFRNVFAFGAGFAFTGYYPALVLLERPDPLGLPALAGWLSPLVALPAAAAAAIVWRTGIRHYRSTGS